MSYLSQLFSCSSYYLQGHGFALVWLTIFAVIDGRHLTLAPAAGHSGWEDNFQADQCVWTYFLSDRGIYGIVVPVFFVGFTQFAWFRYHYVHHAKFECNYGSPMSAFIDQYFGTFREKLGDSNAYKVNTIRRRCKCCMSKSFARARIMNDVAHLCALLLFGPAWHFLFVLALFWRQGEWKAPSDNAVDESNRESASAKVEEKEAEIKKSKTVWSRQGYLGLPADISHGIFTIFWVKHCTDRC